MNNETPAPNFQDDLSSQEDPKFSGGELELADDLPEVVAQQSESGLARILPKWEVAAMAQQDGESKIKALLDVANAYADSGENEDAGRVLASIIESANKIESMYGAVEASVKTALVFDKLGDHDMALKLLDMAPRYLEGRLTGVDSERSDANLAVGSIARGYTAIGEYDKALDTTNLSLNVMRNRRLLTLIKMEIAQAQIEAGDNDGVLTTLESALDDVLKMTEETDLEKFKNLGDVIKLMYDSGHLERALQASNGIDREDHRSDILTKLVVHMAERDDFAEAFTVLQTNEYLNEGHSQVAASRKVVEVLAKANKIDQALRVIGLVPDPQERIFQYSVMLANRLDDTKQHKDIVNTLALAEPEVAQLTIQEQPKALCTIAKSYDHAGESDDYVRLIARALDAWSRLDESTRYHAYYAAEWSGAVATRLLELGQDELVMKIGELLTQDGKMSDTLPLYKKLHEHMRAQTPELPEGSIE